MNLQENISRIKTIMEIEQNDNEISNILYSVFDEKFKSLIPKSELNKIDAGFDTGYVSFYLNDNMIFDKNWWGTLWIRDCNFYNNILSYSRLLSISEEQINNQLINYLNEKYSYAIKDRPIRKINDEFCDEW